MSELVIPNENQREALYDIIGHSFGLSPGDVKTWFGHAGFEHVRAYTVGSAVVGGLLAIPMGQFFGGRSVSTLGVAGVAVTTTERGKGIGAKMMVAMLRGAKAAGSALSSLYPASVTFYRRAGYERAGAKHVFTLDPRNIEVARVEDIDVRDVDTRDGIPEELRALYTATCAHLPGFLDRGPYIWGRVPNPRGKTTKTFAMRHAGKLEGYVVLSHSMSAGGFPTRVDVSDVAASTPRAMNAILRLLIEYRSLGETVEWRGSPSELIANMLPERHVSIAIPDYFMVRVVDVPRAFAQRGFPKHATGGFTLELDDASMPENSGRYGITREGVTVGGTNGSHVKCNERALAALYSGFTSARTLAQAGWLDADDETLSLLDSWFAGPMPTMRDHF